MEIWCRQQDIPDRGENPGIEFKSFGVISRQVVLKAEEERLGTEEQTDKKVPAKGEIHLTEERREKLGRERHPVQRN